MCETEICSFTEFKSLELCASFIVISGLPSRVYLQEHGSSDRTHKSFLVHLGQMPVSIKVPGEESTHLFRHFLLYFSKWQDWT